MISEKTISTWLAEFNKIGESDKTGAKGMEYYVKMQGQMLQDEPMLIAMISQLFGALKIENPLSAAIMSIGIYHDCLRRQREADGLKEEVG